MLSENLQGELSNVKLIFLKKNKENKIEFKKLPFLIKLNKTIIKTDLPPLNMKKKKKTH